MVAYTTTYNFAKPTVGDDEDVWGGYLNGNFDSIENLLKGTTALTSLSLTGTFTIDNTTQTSFNVEYANDGSGIGPILRTFRDSASPAANDLLGGIDFKGNDTTGNNEVFYSRIMGRIIDPTDGSEDGAVDINVAKGGTAAWETSGLVARFDANGMELRGDIIFEGSTANNSETTLTVTNPTADRTITLPDATGTVWTSGNDGSGSGLDADTVDGIQASSFLRSDASDTYTSGTLTFGSGTGLNMSANDAYASMRVIRNANTTSTGLFLGYGNGGSGNTILYGGGSTSATATVKSSGIDVTGTVTASGLGLFEDGLRIGTGSGHGTSGRATISFGEGSPTSDTFLIEYDGDNLSGDANALIFSNNNIGELMRMEYGGAIKLNKIMSTTSGSSGGIRVGANSSGYPNITTVNGVELVIRDTDQIRFSDSTSWDYSAWAGIRYESGSNLMTIGGPSSSKFSNNANPPDITINFDGLSGTNGLTYEGSTIWHAGNDGAGSGLDADNLDGYTWFSYGKNIRAYDLYADSWLRNYYSGKGLYNQATGQHWYSDDDDFWNVAGGTSANGIRFRDEYAGTVRGYVYATASNDVGILDAGASWAIKHRNDQHTQFMIANTVVAEITSSGMDVTGSLTVNGAAVGGGSTHSATASGAIADGDTVIVNSDGTVSSVAISSQPSSISTQGDLETVYNTFYTSPGLAAGEIDVSGTPQTLFMQTFSGYSNRFQYRFGYVSGGAVTVTGTRGTINSNTTYYGCCAFHPTHDTFLTAYRASNHYLYLRAIQRYGANGASGATSSSVSVETSGYASYMNMCYHEAADRMILVWRSNSPTTFCRAIEMTGPTTIWSSGTRTTVNSTSGGGSENGIMYDAQEEVVVFAWEEHVGAKGWLRAATVSGSTFTFGSEVNFSNNNAIWTADNYHIAIAGNGQGKFIVCWRDNNSSSSNYQKGMATLFSLSGTTITELGEVVFNNADTRNISLRYDSVNDNFAVTYKEGSTTTGNANTLTISGSSITVGSTERQIGSSDYKNSSLIRLNDMDAHLTTYNNGDNKLRYVTYETESNETNLAANNFIGFADGAASNGATATIKINGAVDDNQTGLTPATKYYVQSDGSLGTGAGNPSVYAGLAVASTKIIVKG